MKKFLLLFTVFMISLFLVSCSNSKDFTKVKEENLVLFYQNDTKDAVTRDVTLLLKSLEVEGVTIAWESDKPEVIKVFGSKGEVIRGAVDTTVTLTAKITIGKKTQNVEFDLKVLAVEPAKVYDVTFNADGGTALNKVNVSENGLVTKPNDPEKAGFVFLGWFKESTLENKWNFSTDKVNANVTLFAKWAEEGQSVEALLFDFNFSDTDFGMSYGSNLVVTKALPNLVGDVLNVVLQRAASNNNHATYTDDFLILSASDKRTENDYSYVEFDFGKEVSKIEFEASYWSSYDIADVKSFTLQVKNGTSWDDVFDIKAALNGALVYTKVSIPGLTESVYRIFVDGIDPTGSGNNGGRIIVDNMKVFGMVAAGSDLIAPVINGAVDLTFELNAVIDLLSGVSATDDVDGMVLVTVLSSDVDNTKAGKYTVVYEAVDGSGNKVTKTINVTINAEQVVGESLVAHFDFSNTGFGFSYTTNQGITKTLPNLVGEDLSVILHRTVANTNTLYSDEFLLMSASNTLTEDDFSYIVFNFGKVVSRIEFDGAYWSEADASQVTKFSLQVKDGANWVDVYDIKAALDGAVAYKKVSAENLTGQEYRIYAEGIDSTAGANGARILMDNMKVFEESAKDTIAPVINGAIDLTVDLGTEINLLAGVSAIDNVDGEIAVRIYSSNVNTEVEGVYTVVYEAIDASDNRSTVTITVTVNEPYVSDGKLEFSYDFDETNFGNSYVANQNTTKTLKNTVDGSTFTVTLTRVANNSNHAVYTDKFMLFSASTKLEELDYAYAIFDFGKEISSMVFDSVYWSTYDVAQNTKFSLQVDENGSWVDVFDIRAALAETLVYKEIAIENLSGSKYRFYAEGSMSTNANGSRILLDNLEVFTGGGSTPEEKSLNKDLDKLEIASNMMVNGKIDLPVLGLNGSTIAWSLKDATSLVNLTTKDVTMPATGQVTVTFIATLTNGEHTKTKEFNVVLGEASSITIANVYLLNTQSQFKTTGVVTNIFEDANGKKFFIQDWGLGILVTGTTSTVIKLNDEVEIIGVKTNDNGQDVISTVLKVTVLGTKEVSAANVASPLLFESHLGKLISTSGILVNAFNGENEFSLINKFASFDVVIPEGITPAVKSAIISKLNNKEVGILVSVKGNIILVEETFVIVVTSAADITVDTMLNTTIIKEIIDTELILPAGGKVNRDILLPTSLSVFKAVNVTWVSNNPAVLSNTGVVTTAETDQNAVLTYTVKLGTNEIDSGTIDFIVTASGTYDGYYSSLTGLSGNALKSQLSIIISTMKTVSYDDARYILDDSDADVNKTGNLILVYNRASVSGKWDGGTTWNREHVWPQSKLGSASMSDLHNLKPCNQSINSSRGNNAFVDGSGIFGNKPGGWFVGDEDRGDIARIVLYMNVRWGLAIDSQIGSLSTFIKWHNEDPVDTFEANRNNVLYNNQNNRNPFIDYPELVGEIYSQVVTNYESYRETATLVVSLTLDNVQLYQVDLAYTKRENLFA